MRRALLIGIDAYKHEGKEIPRLRGCVTDIDEMAAFLKGRAGYRSTEIRRLPNSRATTYRIKQCIRWLIRNLKRGDRVVLFYSGHGTQMPEPLSVRKAKRFVDAICPYDFNFTPNHVITRRWFDGIAKQVPNTAELLLIFDACHSGDLADPDPRIKRVKPRRDQTLALKSVRARINFHGMRGVGLFAACKSDESSRSARLRGKWHGVFSYFLLRRLKAPKGLKTPLHRIERGVKSDIRKASYGGQRPRLEASKSTRAHPFPH